MSPAAAEREPSGVAVLAGGGAIERAGLEAILADHGICVAATAQSVNDLPVEIHRWNARLAVAIDRLHHLRPQTVRGLLSARVAAPDLGILFLSRELHTTLARDILAQQVTGFGYLITDRIVDADHLMEAVRAVVDGKAVLDAEIIQQVVRAPPRHATKANLTIREREVMGHVSRGLSNWGVATMLNISEPTVEKHLRNCFRKLRIAGGPDANRRVRAVLTYLDSEMGSAHIDS